MDTDFVFQRPRVRKQIMIDLFKKAQNENSGQHVESLALGIEKCENWDPRTF